MDFTSVAGAATAFLAPFIPALVSRVNLSFEEAVKKFGSKLGESTWTRVEALWSLIRRRCSARDAAAERVSRALPDGNADAQQQDWATVGDSLAALMKTDPEFANALAALVADAKMREAPASFDIEKQLAKYIINAHSISHTHIGDRS